MEVGTTFVLSIFVKILISSTLNNFTGIKKFSLENENKNFYQDTINFKSTIIKIFIKMLSNSVI